MSKGELLLPECLESEHMAFFPAFGFELYSKHCNIGSSWALEMLAFGLQLTPLAPSSQAFELGQELNHWLS